MEGQLQTVLWSSEVSWHGWTNNYYLLVELIPSNKRHMSYMFRLYIFLSEAQRKQFFKVPLYYKSINLTDIFMNSNLDIKHYNLLHFQHLITRFEYKTLQSDQQTHNISCHIKLSWDFQITHHNLNGLGKLNKNIKIHIVSLLCNFVTR